MLVYAGGGFGSLIEHFWQTLWVISPYGLIATLTYFIQSLYKRIAMLFASVVCFLANVLYVDSLFLHIDAQGALIFLFLPAYQGITVIVSLCIGTSIGFFKEKISRKIEK